MFNSESLFVDAIEMNEWIVPHPICGKIVRDFFYKTALLYVNIYISIQTNINSKHDED